MKKTEGEFLSCSGVLLDMITWLPEDSPRAVVQIMHGMAEHMGRYDEVGGFLASHGILTVGITYPGHGKKAEIPGYFGEEGWDILLKDEEALRVVTAEEHPGIPYFILGHSMGSFLARCYLMENGNKLSGAVLSGTGWYPPLLAGTGLLLARFFSLIGYKKKPCGPVNAIAFSANNKPFEPGRTPFDWLSRDKGRVDSYIADPYCGFTFTANGFASMFDGLKRLTRLDDLKKIPKTLPVYFLSGDKDPVGQMGKGVRTVEQQFRVAGLTDVTCRLYPDGHHEMLNETNRREVMEELLAWLNEKI